LLRDAEQDICHAGNCDAVAEHLVPAGVADLLPIVAERRPAVRVALKRAWFVYAGEVNAELTTAVVQSVSFPAVKYVRVIAHSVTSSDFRAKQKKRGMPRLKG